MKKKTKSEKIPHARSIFVLLAIILLILVVLITVLLTPSSALQQLSFLGPAKHALAGSRVQLTSALLATTFILLTLVAKLLL